MRAWRLRQGRKWDIERDGETHTHIHIYRHTNNRRSTREPRWGSWDDGLAVSKHQAVFQGCQAHCEALFEMPKLMADIFPMNLACQAAVHYTTLHSDTHELMWSVAVVVAVGVLVVTLAHQGGWNKEGCLAGSYKFCLTWVECCHWFSTKVVNWYCMKILTQTILTKMLHLGTHPNQHAISNWLRSWY